MAKLIMTVAEMADEKKWLEARREGIGGSDASIIVGLNRWKSPFQLWLEKTGKAEPEDLSDNEYVYWGKVLEEVVANRFCELTGKKVQRRGLLQMDAPPLHPRKRRPHGHRRERRAGMQDLQRLRGKGMGG